MSRRSVATLSLLVALPALVAPVRPASPQRPPRALTYADFASFKGISDPQLSPDGKWVLYAVRTTDMDANARQSRTWRMAVDGGAPTPWPDDTTRATEARWSPDGSRIAYVSGNQLWVARANGSSRARLTSLSGGASGIKWAPSGDRLVFVSPVFPDCPNDACNATRAKARADSKVKARVADQLMFRHWDTWDEGTRSHLFVARADGGDLRDVTSGAKYDVPPPPFGGSEAYNFSPDGRELAYTAKDMGREEAWSTDLNVYLVPVTGGAPTVITRANRGADQNPEYSPDGRWIIFASQARAGFESDRWRLMLWDRTARTSRELLPRWDRWAESYFFSPDSRSIYIGAGDKAHDRLFRVALDASARAGAPELVIARNNNTAFSISSDGRTLAWLRDAGNHPPDVWTRSTTSGAPERQLTHENDALLAQLDMRPIEEYWFTGAQADSMHGFVIKPPGWQPGTKYPVILLIHGGPQGAWLDSWSGRWNYQLFAASGAAVVAINPSGSTGYGQQLTDAVTRDWGGKPYRDLMKGLDAALKANPWMDSTRMAAVGGSYGGYMVNWIAGHTNRFKALVSHAGVFNLESMAGATEELWFTDWEFGGPWWNEEAMKSQYRVNSPHLFAKNFKTPTLVIHGELDYRVPYTEGLSLFTALQRQGVPSRLLAYPDEGHWILKPQNHRLWMNEVQAWVARYLGLSKVAS